ncbi:Transposase [Nitrosomonas communis]|uniref:Transposase n=1 Tax=Nitrosomonas communis TaxID=44574 RepID=A0A1H2SGH6_9PROT|nr:Transposase [Nitrosomonas communis]
MLNDEYWSKLEEILPQESIDNKRNLRMTVEGILYRMRVGCPWRDLPQALGCWNSIYKRFNAWSSSRKWINIFKALAIDLDWEWEFIDGRAMLKRKAIVREQRVKNLKLKAKSRAGNTTKIPFGS